MTAPDSAPVGGGLRALLDTLWRLHTRDECAVLGVVVATEGSTYQKPGALVLLDKNGLRHGVISGGCLEPALEHAAHEVLERRQAAVAEFDTRSDEDLIFGSGTGCRGRVVLLLLPVPPQAPLARGMFAALDAGAALELELAIRGEDVGAGSALLASTSMQTPVEYCWDRTGRSAPTHRSQLSAPHAPEPIHIRIAAPARLLLLGAGPETVPLAAFAQRLGWFVTLVEHRTRWAAFAHAAAIDHRIALAPEAAHAELREEPESAVVVMSHNFAIDLSHLTFCARSSNGYVGLLGPSARRDALLAELNPTDRSALDLRLHAPVGLHLGGEGPEAIALAVAAELQQYFSAQLRSIDASARNP